MASKQPEPESEPALEPASGRASRRASRGWRIVARRLNEFGDMVYDVYEGEERRAWGIKDRASARRWLERLAGPGADMALRGRDGDEGERPDRDDREEGEDEESPAGYTPRRVWWNET